MTPPTWGGDALGRGGEFDRIRSFLAGVPRGGPEVIVGPGDDACVLEGGWVLTSDMAVEGVHFRFDWIEAEEAGCRAAAAGLSDLAAMAAEPVGVLVSLAVPGEGNVGERIMEGVKRTAALCGAALLGGDLTRSPGPVVVDVVSLGRTPKPLLRSGARAGDELWVTGSLGAAGAATHLWGLGAPVPESFREAFVRPVPRLAEALWLVRGGARAGLDLSDGLAGDAGHLAAASEVGVILEESGIPVHPELAGMPLSAGVTARELALHGGDDYELLVAAPAGSLGDRVEEFSQRFDLSLSRVGRIVPGEGVFLEQADGEGIVRLGRGGWDHFRGGGGG